MATLGDFCGENETSAIAPTCKAPIAAGKLAALQAAN
jgi:hypothetical protein